MNLFFIWPPVKDLARGAAGLAEEDAYYERYANDFRFTLPAWAGSLWRRIRSDAVRQPAVGIAAGRSGPALPDRCGCEGA